ncbi:MAG: hypothetical protein ACT4O3_02485 [Elusimicrobiota bacterium]
MWKSKVAESPWRQLLRGIDFKGQTLDEGLAALAAKFGPAKVREAEGFRESAFGDGRGVYRVFQSMATADLAGLIRIFAQVAPPAPPLPCPTPGPAGVATGIGSGSVTVAPWKLLAGGVLAGEVALATTIATAQALWNLNGIVRMLCPIMCPAPCRCQVSPGIPPAPVVSTTVNRTFGIPTSVTVTVDLGVSANLSCV